MWQSDKMIADRGPFGPAAPSASPPRLRMSLWWEIAIVLCLSVGRSAVYSVLQLVQALTREQALGDQSTALNPPLATSSRR